MSPHHARVPVAAAPAGAEQATSPAPAPVETAPAPAPLSGLTVGRADDPAEHAADAMADAALSRLRASEPGGEADSHRHDPGCGHLRRSPGPAASGATIGLAGGSLDDGASASIESARGGGAALPTQVRRRMETAFGTGLGHVRVHDGPQAAALSSSMSAQAFTTGSDIFFGAGIYTPDSPDGDRVLAHEIAHVVTEGSPGVRRFLGFGKKKTPAEKAAKEAKKAKEAEDARKVKESHKTQAREESNLKESRKQGVAGREEMARDLALEDENLPAGDPNAPTGTFTKNTQGSGAAMVSLYQLMDQAKAREEEVFAELCKKGVGTSDAKRAEMAYHQVFFDEFPALTSVRPPRETEAERLVAQVRQVRSGAEAGERATAEDKATVKDRMLPKAVEVVYDRMATKAAELLKADPELGEVLAQDAARKAVLPSVEAKTQGLMPKADGPLDQAGWEAAGDRLAARTRQAARDQAAVEANLMLLDPSQRGGATPSTPGEKSGLESAQETMGDVQKYTGWASKGVNTVVGGGLKQGGKDKDKALKDQAQAQGKLTGDADPTGVLPKQVDVLGLNDTVVSGKKAHIQLGRNQRDWNDKKEAPKSDETKAATGIASVTSVIKSLMGAVDNAMAMAGSIKSSWETKDPYEGLKAAKAGSSALSGLVDAAKSTANLAKTIDSGVSDGVKSVIPGLDIATSALAMVRGVTDVATTGMRQRETDLSMFDARVNTTDKVNVMVYPLMKVSQVYTKQLEQNCWTLGTAVMNFSLSVAQVASAGGFGIPAAMKAATATLDKLHDLGHYIADKVLASMAKKAEKESSVQHLEGAAENELKKHPKMAVDGIVVKAAQGDPTALAFLANYRIDGKPITKDYVSRIKPRPVTKFDPSSPGGSGDDSDDKLLVRIRETVFASLGTDEDPQSVYDDLKSQIGKVSGPAGGLMDSWNEAGEVRDKRNNLAKDGKLGENTKSDRGFFWRLRMTLSSEKRQKLKNRTEAYEGVEALPSGVAGIVGSKELKLSATGPELTQWFSEVTEAELEQEISRKPRRNSPEVIDMLREGLREKKDAKKKSKSGKP
ncbi:eCIS core domain-containing protein [Cellulomonas composti]|nr:DUF4157 domain-containing protein [Cellulomonas composti]